MRRDSTRIYIDIMQQYTFNDSVLDFTPTLKVYIAKGHKFTTSKETAYKAK